jgi:uridine kinase
VEVLTHLNPRANDLEKFVEDVVCLADGRSVMSRHYDHVSGKMSRPFRVNSNDLILVSGLHSLHNSSLRDLFDLKIYLDIDESLRRYFKIQRDVHQRGYDIASVNESIMKRERDSAKYIKPQAQFADLVFSLMPCNPNFNSDSNHQKPPTLKLSFRTSNSFDLAGFRRVMIGLCGLHIECQEDDCFEIMVEGEITAADMELSAGLFCPNVLELLDIKPIWYDGVSGLMQLIALSHIDQALKKRLLS